MSTNYTEHLGLTLWESDDPVLRTEFNDNHRKLDARLGAMPRIAVGSYVGDGQSGADHPNTLTFDFTPALLIISKNDLSTIDPGILMIRGQTSVAGFGYLPNASYSQNIKLTWEDRSLSWYTTTGPSNQLNATGDTYCYFAIGV